MKIKDGFIIVNKEKGCTSHDCVKEIRKILGIKKVGHTGTLDPQVTGTLPIAIGSATRFIQYLPQDKTYIGQIKLGIETKTDDIHGERAYKKSLKNEQFELLPREVKIENLLLKKWDQINGILEIKVSCSSGTYIRSIARDLGKILNSEGCLLSLKRISACGFHEKNSIKIVELNNLIEKNSTFIIPTIFGLEHISTFILKKKEEIKFWQTGRVIKFNSNYFIESPRFDYKKPLKIIDSQKNLLGIGFINEERTNLHPKLVLNAK